MVLDNEFIEDHREAFSIDALRCPQNLTEKMIQQAKQLVDNTKKISSMQLKLEEATIIVEESVEWNVTHAVNRMNKNRYININELGTAVIFMIRRENRTKYHRDKESQKRIKNILQKDEINNVTIRERNWGAKAVHEIQNEKISY